MMSKYKVGDFVTFYEADEIRHEATREDENGDYVFKTCDVSDVMLDEIDRWYDNEIASIDEDGDYKFSDFGWTWPVEVIRGMSEDQRNTEELS